MLIVGATLLVDQQINIGQFIAADIVILSIISSVEKLIGNLDKLYESFTSIEKMNTVTEAVTETEGTILLPSSNKGVSVNFDAVNFSYPNAEQVLHQISFQVEPGELVLIKGNSGSGKSSLLRLLTGAFINFEGSVLIDGLPIGNYSLSSLRSQTGVLLNQQDIFRGSLLSNITLGNPLVSTDEILAVTKLTGLDTFIQSNKNGFDTILDPLGKRLPQNIRHQILLTRAILGNNRLLLLEEPFLHLTPQQKTAVLQFLKNKTNTTVIVFSATEETDTSYNRIIEIQNGKLTA